MKSLATVAGVLLLACFLAFVYPTRYRIQDGNINGVRVTMRLDRLTGAIEYATANGWTSAAPKPSGLSEKSRAILEGRSN
jgi:hypothetical protein